MQNSILYEVILTVEPEIRDDYLQWLNHHLEAMLAHDGFCAAKLYFNTENENEFTCHYVLENMAAMRAYLAGPAKDMRADGIRRFGDRFSARRRILEAAEGGEY